MNASKKETLDFSMFLFFIAILTKYIYNKYCEYVLAYYKKMKKVGIYDYFESKKRVSN